MSDQEPAADVTNEQEPKPTKKKSKTKLSRLTANEKLRILDLLSESKTVYAIAKEMDRSQWAVGKVAEEFKAKSMTAFNQDVSSIPENTSIEPTDYIDTEVYHQVLKKLKQAGVNEIIARQRIAKICNKAQENDIKTITSQELFEAAISTMNGSELFAQNDSGASILTKAASEAADNLQKQTVGGSVVDGIRIHRIF